MTKSRGRPRKNPASPTGRGAEQDILHAAGELFARRGFGSTSTRAVAELAGLQQASVYHYFSSKEDVLLRLVLGTVVPSRRFAERLVAADAPAHVKLWALCFADTRLLLEDPQNLGALYFSPELRAEGFEEFHENRDALEGIYGDLLERTAGRPATPFEAAIVMGLAENVILQRQRAHPHLPEDAAERIADAALHLAGVPHLVTEDNRRRARALVENLAGEPGTGDA
ncbi:TetR/AcrR family transcriptional regulator [Kocuria sp.]|uniref:TetR/AcrR family transcriptional regulator n=1 Tax=Kocuria sp. TaxID=1871328 RepID=UPI00281108FE|nr:TetR/AcrR family transcriptional regulator [Kocuria sp.]